MNERMRDLRRQATLVETYTANNGNVIEAKNVDLDKFAELIVKECSKVNNQYIGWRIGDIDLDMVYKEHFGVEE